MLHLNNYNDFLLKENINWFNNELLTINESKSIDKLTEIWNRISSKAKKLNKKSKDKFYGYTLVTLLSLYSYGELKTIIGSNDKDAIEILNNLKYGKDAKDKTEDIEDNTKSINLYKNPLEIKVSSNGRKNIKEEEGDPKVKGEPVLTAYNLGDGMITIGWGHAEKKSKSKFKVGQKITREKAQELLQKDLQASADAVRRIFKEWEEKGIHVELTQDQFDALVSITFNAGIGNVRRSDFIQSIKKNKLKKAGEQILNFKINRYAGLVIRRKKEAAPFINT